MKTYRVTVESVMTERAVKEIRAESQEDAESRVDEMLEAGGWFEVFGDTSGDLIDVQNSVIAK